MAKGPKTIFSSKNYRVVRNKSGSNSIRTKNNCTGKWKSKSLTSRKKK